MARVCVRRGGMGPDVRWSVSVLERQKARDDGLACVGATALTASGGVNCDHEIAVSSWTYTRVRTRGYT